MTRRNIRRSITTGTGLGLAISMALAVSTGPVLAQDGSSDSEPTAGTVIIVPESASESASDSPAVSVSRDPVPSVTEGLSDIERARLEQLCLPVQYRSGAAAYRECVSEELDRLSSAEAVENEVPVLSFDEQYAVQQSCQGLGASDSDAYRACEARQLVSLDGVAPATLERLREDERFAVQQGCFEQQTRQGVRAYRECLNASVTQLLAMPQPDLASLSLLDRNTLQRRCSALQGSAIDYRNCLNENAGTRTDTPANTADALAEFEIATPVDAVEISDDTVADFTSDSAIAQDNTDSIASGEDAVEVEIADSDVFEDSFENVDSAIDVQTADGEPTTSDDVQPSDIGDLAAASADSEADTDTDTGTDTGTNSGTEADADVQAIAETATDIILGANTDTGLDTATDATIGASTDTGPNAAAETAANSVADSGEDTDSTSLLPETDDAVSTEQLAALTERTSALETSDSPSSENAATVTHATTRNEAAALQGDSPIEPESETGTQQDTALSNEPAPDTDAGGIEGMLVRVQQSFQGLSNVNRLITLAALALPLLLTGFWLLMRGRSDQRAVDAGPYQRHPSQSSSHHPDLSAPRHGRRPVQRRSDATETENRRHTNESLFFDDDDDDDLIDERTRRRFDQQADELFDTPRSRPSRDTRADSGTLGHENVMPDPDPDPDPDLTESGRSNRSATRDTTTRPAAEHPVASPHQDSAPTQEPMESASKRPEPLSEKDSLAPDTPHADDSTASLETEDTIEARQHGDQASRGEAAHESAPNPTHESTRESTPEPSPEPTHEPAPEPTPEPTHEPTHEPVHESTHGRVHGQVHESDLEAANEPAPEQARSHEPVASDSATVLDEASDREGYLAWLSVQDDSRQASLAIEFLIYWMAYADERYPPALRQKIMQMPDPSDSDLVKRRVLKQDVHAFAGNLQWLQQHQSPVQKEQIVRLLLALLVNENALTPSQNTLLRFLADAFGIGLEGLSQLYRDGFAQALPHLPRPDKPAWWQQQAADDLKRWDGRSVSRQSEDIQHRVRLGLPFGLELQEVDILDSYHRAAARCDPAQFDQLPARAQSLARNQLSKYELATQSLLEVCA